MDLPSLARFAPEAAVLAIAGYFAVRCLVIFKDIVDNINSEQKTSLDKLSKAIDKNTKSNEELMKASKQQHQFMVNLNGKLTTATKQTIKENE